MLGISLRLEQKQSREEGKERERWTATQRHDVSEMHAIGANVAQQSMKAAQILALMKIYNHENKHAWLAFPSSSWAFRPLPMPLCS